MDKQKKRWDLNKQPKWVQKYVEHLMVERDLAIDLYKNVVELNKKCVAETERLYKILDKK